MSNNKELTTQQAADLLNVSHEYLISLLDNGSIPFFESGERCLVDVDDLMAFKEHRDRERDAALTELSRLSQEFEAG